MNNETRVLLTELSRHSGDPVAFSTLRKKVLESYFNSQAATRRPHLQAWQDHIEAARAAAGTPVRAIGALVGDLNDRCEALETLKEQLMRLKDAD